MSTESNWATLDPKLVDRKNSDEITRETRMTEQELYHRSVDRNDFGQSKVVISPPELRPETETEDMMSFFKNLASQIDEDVDSFYDI